MKATRHSIRWCAAATFALALAAPLAPASVGTMFTFQGQLKDGGVPADGNYDFIFQLHDDPSLDSQVGSDQPMNDWYVSDGLFTVELDFGSVFTGDALWLQVSVRPGDSTGAYADLLPRQPLDAAPYALYALDGPGSAGHWAASGIDIHNANSGNVGIGTSTPAATLDVVNAGSAYAIQATSPLIPVYAVRNSSTGSEPAVRGESDSATANAAAVLGVLTNDTPGSGAAAVKGHVQTAGAYGIGTRGDHNGDGWGVYGTSVGGTGVYGSASGTSGTNYGVRGRTWSPDGYGVYGLSSTGTGVYGLGGGTSGTNYGVRGETASPSGYAGYFVGGQNYFEGNVGMGLSPSAQLTVFNLHAGEQPAVQVRTPGSPGTYDLVFEYCNINARSLSSGTSRTLLLNNDSAGSVLLANGGGNVGIGTDYAQARLHVDSTDVAISYGALCDDDVIVKDGRAMLGLYSDVNGGGGITIAETDAGYLQDKWSIYRTEGTLDTLKIGYGTDADHNNNPTLMAITAGGNVGIGTIFPAARLDVAGTARFAGNVVIASATSGATLIEFGEGLDYAEGFDVSDPSAVTPGTVVVIDPDNAGKLVISDTPYDRKVAGIVAGANGLGSAVRLGAGEFDLDVALAGRVYCNVDATYGAVQPGDLLTTSATPGCAMKVADHTRAQGAILGKAMQPLRQGERGRILVLVTLQ
jgi:hypothetical protein